jgi:hypothetical protein
VSAPIHLAHLRSLEPACREKQEPLRRTLDLSSVTCEACIDSTHYAARERNAKKKVAS